MRTIALLLLATLSLAAAEERRFTGNWSSDNSGTSGSIKMNLKATPEDSDVSFTLSGYDVKTKVKTLKMDNGRLEMTYEFDIQGNKLLSTVTAGIDADKLDGKYSTKALADGSAVDSGVVKGAATK